jgi:hypothetical protein
MRQMKADQSSFADGGQRCENVVARAGYVYCDVSSIALCPTFLPQIASHFGHLTDGLCQSFTSFENAFHCYMYFMSFGVVSPPIFYLGVAKLVKVEHRTK